MADSSRAASWTDSDERAIAIVGMAGRFPGACDLAAYWRLLIDGRDGITRFSEASLRAAGVPEADLRDPAYVRANGLLDDVELFDAGFFGMPPLEAEITDPQHRLFLECAWHALEDAGYTPDGVRGRVGVFAGAGLSTYLLHNLLGRADVMARVSPVQLSIGNNKDYVPTRVSYKLNLTGPSISVNTACSSSLVAVHLACQSLLDYHSDMVLAGGVGIQVPQGVGYRYLSGGIVSPDGHCRPFDARAQGTVSGNGVGIVVLKRLADAVADGDTVRAVILGSAVNNDGAAKVGYTAPSVDGQAAVIAEALAVGEVDPETVQYVEGHGTGTAVGDPIEVAALTQAFRRHTARTGFCVLGSVKSNIGHLDEAAGVAGLIKTVLALEHRQIPPTLHFVQGNAEIDFPASPFYVNAAAREWESDRPRRAGVSSFGIGGTNAHVVLEEAPPVPHASASSGAHVLTLSARSAAALDRLRANLASHLRDRADVPLADVAWTLQQGRRAFEWRHTVTATDHASAIARLHAPAAPRQAGAHPHVVFLFPGQGAQYSEMGRGLYREEPLFRDELDRCAALLAPQLGFDIRQPLTAADTGALTATLYAQPALFAVEYALARLLMSWGIQPSVMVGHSLGELVAATLAGVFSLEDATTVVAARARLMSEMPPGAMLAVRLSESDVAARLRSALTLSGLSELSVAAVNAPERCVVSGPQPAIERFEAQLTADDVAHRRLETSHAFHSSMMDAALPAFVALLSRIPMRPPTLPWISNVTGAAITPAQATGASYWAEQVRRPVQFARAANAVLADPEAVFVEVGPGRTLTTLLRAQAAYTPDRVSISSMRSADQSEDDRTIALEAAGHCWSAGVRIDWSAMHQGERRRRVPLPCYPFERERYWVDPKMGSVVLSGGQSGANVRVDGASAPSSAERAPLDDWFYLPSWKRTPLPRLGGSSGKRTVVIASDEALASRLVERLRGLGDEAFGISDPANAADSYAALLEDADRVLDLSTLGQVDPLAHVFALCRAIAEARREIELVVVTAGAEEVTGAETLVPEQSAVLGPLLALSQEHAGVRTRLVDIDGREAVDPDVLGRSLGEEVVAGTERVVALRGGRRWVRTFDRTSLPASPAVVPLREGGTYLITGGLGGVGLIIAEHLAATRRARLVLTGRSAARTAAALGDSTAGQRDDQRDDALAEAEDALVAAVAKAAQASAVRGVDAYPGLEAAVSRFCCSHVVALIRGAGIDVAAGRLFDLAATKSALSIVAPLDRIGDLGQRVLLEHGHLRRAGDGLTFAPSAAMLSDPQRVLADLHREYPQFAGTFDLLQHCFAAYPAALRGDVPAISVLYPDGEATLLEAAAARTVAHSTRDIYVRAVRDLLVERCRQRPGTRLRVLEVGVGDGILAGVVAPALQGLDVEYHATDLGRSFVARARQAAAGAGLDRLMRYGLLDISRDPVEQGYQAAGFDVVLALDVLHATPDVRQTMAHVRRLVAPGGAAVVIETVRPPLWVEFIWGLAEGWWAYRDDCRQPCSPLLSAEAWRHIFDASGFDRVTTLPEDKGRAGPAQRTRQVDEVPRDEQTGGNGDYAIVVGQVAGSAAGTRSHAADAVRRMRAAGSDVLLVAADVADEAAMRGAVAEALSRYGRLDGVIHAAGVTARELIVNPIESTGPAELHAVLRPKLEGARVLATVLDGVAADFVMLVSSNASVLGGVGLAAYAAASRSLDAFAAARHLRGDTRWISTNWDGWPTEATGGFDSGFRTSIDRYAMSRAECREAFERVLTASAAQVIVSAGDLAPRLARWVENNWGRWSFLEDTTNADPGWCPPKRTTDPSYRRPAAAGAIVPPETETERQLALVWQELLGIAPIGAADVFAELGGDSLLGTQLISRVERLFGCRLPFRSLFEEPTLRHQAARIDVLRAAAATSSDPIPHLPRREVYPLSDAQRRLWVLTQLDASAAYNIPLHQLLDGPLDQAALERALHALVARHETLRTRIIVRDGEPWQLVDPPGAAPLRVRDLTQEPSPEAAAREVARAEALTRFDLAASAPFRASLIKLAAARHVLLVTVHHIICDGVSIGVLARDLAALYRACSTGTSSELPELRLQYRDYAAWQQALVAGGRLASQRDYWLRQLGAPGVDGAANGAPPLALPVDFPRPDVQTFVGHELTWLLPPEGAQAIGRLARERRVSLFMMLTACVKVLLHRYTGQQDLVVGTPVAGRTHQDLEGQVGFYLNMLALRDHVRGDMTFAALLDRVRETATAAYDNQAYPFDRLVDELEQPRDLSRSPVFDVIVILQNQQESLLELAGLQARPFFEHNATSKADLTFSFKESSIGLAVAIEFNTDLFTGSRIERMGEHFLALLRAFVRDAHQRIGDVQFLTSEECSLLTAANETRRALPAQASVVEWVGETAQRTPGRVAVRCGSTSLTGADVVQLATTIAASLVERGVRRGDRVGVCLDRCAEIVPALLGILAAGAAYVPLDPAFPLDRLRYMVRDSGMRVVVTSGDMARLAAATANDTTLTTVLVDDVPPATGPLPASSAPRPSDLAYVLYTSGSTGRPKGVGVEHRSLVNFLGSMAQEPGLGRDDVLLAVTTLSFDIAGLELFLPLVCGATVVVAGREDAADGVRLQAVMRQSGATVMQATPATWQMLLETGWTGDPRLDVLCGGEALPAELARHLGETCGRVWNLYGPTETTIWSSVFETSAAGRVPPGSSSADPAGPLRETRPTGSLRGTLSAGPLRGTRPTGNVPVAIGRPIANTTLHLLDRYLQLVPPGVPGEIYIGGEGVARGYLNQPALTAERFVPDPFSSAAGARMYRTGDLGVRRSDGVLDFLGRLDDQVKIRGFRIEIGEIENVLLQHPLVSRAAVVVDRSGGGSRLIAAVVPRTVDRPASAGAAPGAPAVAADRPVDLPADLRQHLRGAVPDYMVPGTIVAVQDLPRTPNGKIDRQALRAAASRVMPPPADVAPATPLQQQIASVWADVLGVAAPGVDADFFAAGGHSLNAARLAFRITAAVGVTVGLVDVFQHPTIAGLAALCETRGAGAATVTPPPPPVSVTPIPIAPLTADELDMLNG